MAGTRKTRNARENVTYSKKKQNGKRAPLGEIDTNGAGAQSINGRGKTVKKSKTRRRSNQVEEDVPTSISIPNDPVSSFSVQTESFNSTGTHPFFNF